MKILVTSGGTSEAIDSFRSITTHSTGHLGK
ncbi:phosphopantothenate--cysteine ligase, partial [Streptococcus pneumoniae]